MSLFEDTIRRGTRAAQPAANTVVVGTLYFVTDESIIERSTGAAWESYSGSGSAITALTSDVTATGPGSVAATIANDAVTYAKMQNTSAADILLGRGNGGGAGDVQEITLGTNLSLAGTVLNASGGAGSDVLRAEINLSDAQIKSLSTVPIEIVAAQGAGTIILPYTLFLVKDSSAGAYSTDPSINLRFSGLAVDLMSGLGVSLNTASKTWTRWALTQINANNNSAYNLGLVIRSAADVTGGNVANYIKGHVIYTVLSGV